VRVTRPLGTHTMILGSRRDGGVTSWAPDCDVSIVAHALACAAPRGPLGSSWGAPFQRPQQAFADGVSAGRRSRPEDRYLGGASSCTLRTRSMESTSRHVASSARCVARRSRTDRATRVPRPGWRDCVVPPSAPHSTSGALRARYDGPTLWDHVRSGEITADVCPPRPLSTIRAPAGRPAAFGPCGASY
jgi:hypothetical protein